MSWTVSAFSWTSIAKTKVSQHPVSLIQCGPSSQFVFEPVSRDCQPPLPLLLSLSFYLTLHHSFTLPYHYSCAFICCRPPRTSPCCLALIASLRGRIRDVTLLLCSLLFLPLSLLTLATESRVLVCPCCFFDTFTPAARFTAEE